MRVKYVKSEPVAKNIISFYFEPEKRPQHIAGQFIELKIPHEGKDKRGDKRWFTLSSSPEDKYLSITTKFTDAKASQNSSFKNELLKLKPGTELYMAAPMGDFVLPKNSEIPLLFVAGGIGVTPFHSIIKYISDTGEKRNITLLYAARSGKEIAFELEFNKLGNKFIKFIDERYIVSAVLCAEAMHFPGNSTFSYFNSIFLSANIEKRLIF
jgi:glycine betaine catabolism B